MAPLAGYDDNDALGLAELVRNKQVTAAELVDEALRRIDLWDSRLHAVVTRLDDIARRDARGELPQGPFSGVPFVLKDLIAQVAGVPLRQGSRLYDGYRPTHDDELVTRYRRAGLICVARSSTPELGLTPVTEPEIHPPTETPWKAGHTSGGSSGGSAALVGARVVPIGHGGDGGGSLRIPASCCGIFGLKPSRGRIPCGPDYSDHWFGLASEHAVTVTVRDSAALLDASAGPETMTMYGVPTPERPFLEEVTRAPGKLRIAFTAKPHLPADVHPDAVAAVRDAARLCESLGHEVVEAAPPIDASAFSRNLVIVVATATAADLVLCEKKVGRRARREDVDRETWLVAMLGRGFSAVDFTIAREELATMVRGLKGFFDRHDVLLTPTLAMPPVKNGALRPRGAEALLHEVVARADLQKLLELPLVVDAMASKVWGFIPFTPLANVTGQPSMSVPLYWNNDGLPIGTTFTARFGHDATLFRLAGQLEQARPWRDRRPPPR